MVVLKLRSFSGRSPNRTYAHSRSKTPKTLDFFDQPKPSPKEIPEGTVRHESVIGSYAVYHKTKANHRIGDTI